MRKLLTAFSTFLLLFSLNTQAQETFPINGIPDKRVATYAFTHATIYVDANTVIKDATLLIVKNKIVAAGQVVTIPPDAVVYNCSGKYIYPSLIDIYADYGIPARQPQQRPRGPQMESATPGAYNWNQAIRPETDAFRLFSKDAAKAEEWRKSGFGAVMTHQKDGIARGTGALISLSDENENDVIFTERAAACYSFDKGTSTQDYPSSLMGSIALIRQTYYDADWYASATDRDIDISLKAFNEERNLPQIFDAGDILNSLRVAEIGKEFNVKYIIKGGNDEYKYIASAAKTGSAFIVPLKFPETIDVTDPYDAINVSLEQLKHWELAPANAAALEKAGIPFVFTTDGLKDKKELYKNIRKAIELGLSKEQALKSLTETPAQLLKADKMIGALRPGMMASFIISTKELFDKDNILLENWVSGKRFMIRRTNLPDLRGNYTLTAGNQSVRMRIGGDIYTPEINIIQDSSRKKVTMTNTGQLIMLSFESLKPNTKGIFRLNGLLDADPTKMQGTGIDPDGNTITWKAVFDSVYIPPVVSDSAKEKPVTGEVWYPNMAFGSSMVPTATSVLIKNATVWTNEKDGILDNTDVLITNGKIAQIGKNISASQGTETVDGTGKHLTAGIIDEHSHIAASGSVNEGAQNSSAEVRIGDVVDCTDINIYRQLAGGVTTSHILHGSANPIGGQTQLIKLRWGHTPQEMKFEGWDGFIKFALGENVKQSHWGDDQVIRYPQTRMGVEQVFIDAFTRARNYDNSWKNYNLLKDKNKIKPRRDLELDAIAEILNKNRFITCHSYVQSEINMLMHVADSFQFKVNTFTHILEGYKVADKMKARGANASTFADWWAYKYEVMEAIPYNASILNKMGVNTSMNSDDAEMARRLNQEAAKAVKYGNTSEEDAWKMVTLNPAIMLHISDRVGSIKVGKDADVVLWNNDPLSIYAKPLKTYIDGVCYFDIEKDVVLRQQTEKERARIIQKMIIEKGKGGEVAKPVIKPKKLKHCDDTDNDY